MRIDVAASRLFPITVCALVGAAAYFQASGFGQLVAGSIASAAERAPSTSDSPRVAAESAPAKSGAAIVERNPFDSATSLTARAPTSAAVATVKATLDGDPYADPPCEGVRALLVVASVEPAWSFAALAGADGKSVLRRSGDRFGDREVQFLGQPGGGEGESAWDRVWLSDGATRCQAHLGGPVIQAAPPKPAARPAGPVDTLAREIRRLGPGEVELDRATLERILADSSAIASVRATPVREGDRATGVRLFGVRPGSLFAALGVEDGDTLQRVNGFAMAEPEAALMAYARLRSADQLAVDLVRKGKPTNLIVHIR